MRAYRITARYFESQADSESTLSFLALSNDMNTMMARFNAETDNYFQNCDIAFSSEAMEA